MGGLSMVTGQQAVRMIKHLGAVIVDVRPDDKFKQATAKGAAHIPLLRPVMGHSFGDVKKKAVASYLGLQAKERNPDFATVALELLPRDRPIIIVCEYGGALTAHRYHTGTLLERALNLPPRRVLNDPDQYSSSFVAAYELFEAGFTKLFYLEGGFRNWPGETVEGGMTETMSSRPYAA